MNPLLRWGCAGAGAIALLLLPLPARADERPCPPEAEARAYAASQPQDALTRLGLGYALACNGRLEEAIAIFESLIASDPDFAAGFDVYAELGQAWQQLGEIERAIAAYQDSIRFHGDPQSPSRAALLALQAQGYDAPLPEEPPAGFSSDDLVQLADEQAQAERWDEAIALYRRALERNPNHTAAAIALGDALAATMQPRAAREAYEQAIATDRQSATAERPYIGSEVTAGAYVGLAQLLAASGQYPEAIATFRRALVLHPGYADAFRGLAETLADSGDWDGAIAAYQPYLQLYETPDVYTDFGDFLADRQAWEPAIAAFRRALASDPFFTWAYLGLGRALAGSGQIEAAIATYQQLLDWMPSVEAYQRLAGLHWQQGDRAAAAAALRAALSLEPDNPHLQRQLEGVTAGE